MTVPSASRLSTAFSSDISIIAGIYAGCSDAVRRVFAFVLCFLDDIASVTRDCGDSRCVASAAPERLMADASRIMMNRFFKVI